jgi:hypothetical protein
MNDERVPERPMWPALVALSLNLIPVAGVVLWGWSAFALIFLYWLENLVIGVRTLASMGASGIANGGEDAVAAVPFGAFFTFHYGMFCFVHGIFVVVLFGPGMSGFAPAGLLDAAQALLKSEPGLGIGLASVVLWQAVQFALFLIRGEARDAHPLGLMATPYPRIIILHVTIICGGFLLKLLNEPLAGLILLALIKSAFDVAEAMGKKIGPVINLGLPGEEEPPANQA